MNLSHEGALQIAITPTNGVAGVADIKGTDCDMEGYEGVLMVVTFGTITGSAVTSIKAQQSVDTTDGNYADLTGTGQTIADTDDDMTFYIDLFQPEKRYVRLYVDRGTQNAVVASATYIKYGAKVKPVDQGSNVSGEFHQSPIEGTA
jgi:hypothetical protein